MAAWSAQTLKRCKFSKSLQKCLNPNVPKVKHPAYLGFLLSRKGLMHVSIIHHWEALSFCFHFTTRHQRTLNSTESFKSVLQHLNFVISAISFNQSQSARYKPFFKSPSHQCQTFPNDGKCTIGYNKLQFALFKYIQLHCLLFVFSVLSFLSNTHVAPHSLEACLLTRV